MAEEDDRRPQLRVRVIRPLRDFLHTEAAGGGVLVAATLVALVWANSPAKASYHDLWTSPVVIGFRDHVLRLDLRACVNDGLMALFFFVVGLEIKRELVVGELRDPRRAALPVIAALGGMLVPALLYLALNSNGHGSRGWGIPMATDIAMAVGVVSLLGARVAPQLKLFLLALAIVDDIGAILVIACFYSRGLDGLALAAALALVLLVVILRIAGVRFVWVYAAVGLALWLAVHEGGVHATIVGVVMGLLTPTRPVRPYETHDDEVRGKLVDVSTVEAARETTVLAREAVPVVAWLEHVLHPWSSYVVVPVFALANAGVEISAESLDEAVRSPITQGVVLGLVVGKVVGIAGFSWLACRLRLASLPDGAGWRGILGVAALGGIGFTVSIFVANLAFGPGPRETQAKLGILAASLLAAGIGALVLGKTEARAR